MMVMMMIMMCKRLAQVPMLCVPIYNMKLAMMQKTPVFTTFSAQTKMAADKRGQIEVFARIFTYTHIYTYTYLHLCIYTYTYLHLCIYICIYIYKYVYAFIPVYVYIYLYTYIQTYIHTDRQTYIYRYIHTYINTYIHKYIHTYIHIYIYVYIYICACVCNKRTCTYQRKLGSNLPSYGPIELWYFASHTSTWRRVVEVVP